MSQPNIEVPDYPDDETPRCPNCGARMIHDWEGDPGVIGGMRDLLTCTEGCGSMVPEGTPLSATEDLFDWARKNGLME